VTVIKEATLMRLVADLFRHPQGPIAVITNGAG
jgi:hypothetical protein